MRAYAELHVSSPSVGGGPKGAEEGVAARDVPLRLAKFILRPRFARTGGLGTSPTLGGGKWSAGVVRFSFSAAGRWCRYWSGCSTSNRLTWNRLTWLRSFSRASSPSRAVPPFACPMTSDRSTSRPMIGCPTTSSLTTWSLTTWSQTTDCWFRWTSNRCPTTAQTHHRRAPRRLLPQFRQFLRNEAFHFSLRTAAGIAARSSFDKLRTRNKNPHPEHVEGWARRRVSTQTYSHQHRHRLHAQENFSQIPAYHS